MGRQCPRSTRSRWLGRGDDNGIDGRPHSGPRTQGPRRDATRSGTKGFHVAHLDQSGSCWRRVAGTTQRFHQDDRRYDRRPYRPWFRSDMMSAAVSRSPLRQPRHTARVEDEHQPACADPLALIRRTVAPAAATSAGDGSPTSASNSVRVLVGQGLKPWRRTSAATACCRSSDAGGPVLLDLAVQRVGEVDLHAWHTSGHTSMEGVGVVVVDSLFGSRLTPTPPHQPHQRRVPAVPPGGVVVGVAILDEFHRHPADRSRPASARLLSRFSSPVPQVITTSTPSSRPAAAAAGRPRRIGSAFGTSGNPTRARRRRR